jgi:hypothetical protein
VLRHGDTLFVADHLCAVISDPLKDPQRVVLVSFTTFETWKDDTCCIEPDEHPFVRHLTSISYSFPAKTFSLEYLMQRISDGHVRTHEPLSPKLLAKVLVGANETEDIPMGHWNILDEQGLFD